MKNKLMGFIFASAAIVFGAHSASAAVIKAGSQINTGGTLIGLTTGTLDTATGLNFTNPGDPLDLLGTQGLLAGATGSMDFAFLSCSTSESAVCGFIQDIGSFATFAGNSTFMVVLPGGINFRLNAPLSVTRAAETPSSLATLILSGTGLLSGTGFDATNAVFTLVTQGNNSTTFSASIVSLGGPTIPEPASMLLLGAGLAGIVLTRRKKAQRA